MPLKSTPRSDGLQARMAIFALRDATGAFGTLLSALNGNTAATTTFYVWGDNVCLDPVKSIGLLRSSSRHEMGFGLVTKLSMSS